MLVSGYPTEICRFATALALMLRLLCFAFSFSFDYWYFVSLSVEKLFLSGDILVLVATATLAWGVNLPAHLVIVKGTEYFDGKQSRYVDYPLTDVLQ